MATIRTATSEDFGIIRQIAEQTWPITYGKILSAEQIRYMLDLFYSEEALAKAMDGGQKFILLIDDAPVGFAGYQHYDGMTKLHKLYILPEMQGKGYGRLLMNEVESAAKVYGSKKLKLNVNRFNNAIEFYRAAGFEVESEEDIDIGNGYLMEDYVMMRRLQP